MRSTLTRLLDEILSILKRQKKSISEFGQELGLSSRAGDTGYNQLYNWLVVRRYKPKGDIVLRFAEWRDKQKKYGRSKSDKSKSKKS